jgi:hypothetical protein
MGKWTREMIIREILRREAVGLPLSLGGSKKGVESKLYKAGSRIFGSWGNAVQAAGIAPERAMARDHWPPSKVLSKIRILAHRQQPIQPGELKRQYGYLVQAARRCFGSWSKAVVAAGVEPDKLKGIMPWTKERILEAILMRALNCEPLGSQSVNPRSLSKAGAREFGSWLAALRAAGIDPRQTSHRVREIANEDPDAAHEGYGPTQARNAFVIMEQGKAPRRRRSYRRWSTEEILQAIRNRAGEGKRMNAAAVDEDDGSLYRAAARRFGNWRAALVAAGVDPDEIRAGIGTRSCGYSHAETQIARRDQGS